MTLADGLFEQLGLSEKKLTLISILADEYGVGPVVSPKEAVLWAFTALRKEVGVKEAEKQLDALNRMKEKHGAPLVYKPHNY